ncbi:MAG: valine--tRNA ligase, partial [Verrucomicrobiota bacterium]
PGPDGKIWLTIATTRPETIPGDTAVAVNPKDTRYTHLIGKHIIRPLPIHLPHEKKLIPIIADEHVDFEFGTGVLKVTPAHDQADFDIGQRHKLPIVDIMNPDGTMNELAGESLAGLDRFEARAVAVERLKEIGALVEEKPYENNVGFSQRADVPIEPRLSEQWFLKYPSVQPSMACVADGRMKFHPDRWAKVYDHWLTNIQDWCISRQLWWGHRVPVWVADETRASQGQLLEALEILRKANPKTVGFAVIQSGTRTLHGPNWTSVDKHIQAIEACIDPSATNLMNDLEGLNFTQDPDVLDTWCSSWLWPFATMGWTGDKAHDSNTPTLRAFYPTTDLVTGPDIIFFWVARMIMAGYEYMGDLPFRNVYFTGIIRDKQGRKMSKTLGNSPDPLELIAKYGADALRFGTMRSAPLGQDVLFDEKDVELGRNFCNKLWNACRFRQMQSSAGVPPASASGVPPGDFEAEIHPDLLTSDDKWILLRLDQAIREITTAFAEYKFNEATATLYRFFWSEYCDWYVEASKAALGRFVEPLKGENVKSDSDSTIQRFNDSTSPKLRANKLAVIDFVLGNLLRLFHPFLPFITEELWHGMGFSKDMPADRGGQSIMFAPWPKPLTGDEKSYFGLDDTADQVAAAKYELVTMGRNLRRELKLDPAKKLKFILKPSGELPAAEIEVLKLLLNAEAIDVVSTYAPPKGTPSASNPLGDLYLPLAGLIDMQAERTRLQKEIAKVDAEIEKVRQKLANPNFTQKVPAKVLEEHQQRLSDWQNKKAQLQASLDALSG